MLPSQNLTDKSFVDKHLPIAKKQFLPKVKEINEEMGLVVEYWDKQVMLNNGFDIRYEHLMTFHPWDYELYLPNFSFPFIVDVKCSSHKAITLTLSDREINSYIDELKILYGYQVLLRVYSQTFPDNINDYTFIGTYSLNSLWRAGRVNVGDIPDTWMIYLDKLPGHEFNI